MNRRITNMSLNDSINEESVINKTPLNAVLVFSIGVHHYGIDTDQVCCFIPPMSLTLAEEIPLGLNGLFVWKDKNIPLLNIAKLLGKKEPIHTETIIFCKLNQFYFCFKVDNIIGFYDLSTSNPPPVFDGHGKFPSIVLGDHQVLLPDFATLTRGTILALRHKQITDRQRKNILLIHNSSLLREMLTIALQTSGYINLIELDNSNSAWHYLIKKYAIDDLPDLIIIGSTDQHTLAHLQSFIFDLKTCLHFCLLPVILLANQYDFVKSSKVDACINPFDLNGLIERIDDLVCITY